MPSFVLNSAERSWCFELKPGLNRIGRNPTNDFRIPDGSVSSFHAEVTLDENSAALKDLCSTNGTFLNGRQVGECSLSLGDTIQFGAIPFTVEADLPSVAIPELSKPEEAKPAFMPDGAPACLSHPSMYAAFRCQKCAHTFCASCVRSLRRAGGGAAMTFCIACGGQCSAIEAPSTAPARKKGFFGRLTQTLRLPFR